MDYIGNGNPMHVVCIPHRTFRTVKVKQEEEADTRIIAREE